MDFQSALAEVYQTTMLWYSNRGLPTVVSDQYKRDILFARADSWPRDLMIGYDPFRQEWILLPPAASGHTFEAYIPRGTVVFDTWIVVPNSGQVPFAQI